MPRFNSWCRSEGISLADGPLGHHSCHSISVHAKLADFSTFRFYYNKQKARFIEHRARRVRPVWSPDVKKCLISSLSMKSNVRPGVRVKQQRCAELLGEPRKAFRKLVQDCVPVNDAARWCNLKLVPVRIKLRVPDA